MQRNLLIAAVIGAIALALWWWQRRDEPDRITIPVSGSGSESASASRVPVPGLPAVGDGSRPAVDGSRPAPPPEEPQVNTTAIQARMHDAHAHLQDAAKPCLALGSSSHPAPDAQFRFSYRLTIAGGEARISDVTLVWSDLKSAAMETCLLEKLAAARWSTTEGDFSRTVEDSLNGGELQ